MSQTLKLSVYRVTRGAVKTQDLIGFALIPTVDLAGNVNKPVIRELRQIELAKVAEFDDDEAEKLIAEAHKELVEPDWLREEELPKVHLRSHTEGDFNPLVLLASKYESSSASSPTTTSSTSSFPIGSLSRQRSEPVEVSRRVYRAAEGTLLEVKDEEVKKIEPVSPPMPTSDIDSLHVYAGPSSLRPSPAELMPSQRFDAHGEPLPLKSMLTPTPKIQRKRYVKRGKGFSRR